MFSCSSPVDSNAVPSAVLTANVKGTHVFLMMRLTDKEHKQVKSNCIQENPQAHAQNRVPGTASHTKQIVLPVKFLLFIIMIIIINPFFLDV